MNKRDVPDGAGVTTTRRTFALLETLKDDGGGSITELTERVDLPKSTVYRHLKTLEDLGYVVEHDDEYHLGLQFLELSEQARNRRKGFAVTKWKTYELAQESGEQALFLVEENYEGVYLHRVGRRFETLIGKRRPLNATASGKVILSEWSEDELTRFIEEKGLYRMTENTITDPDELRDELDQIRERGYAVNDEEHMGGLRAVAVPVYTPGEELLGGLSVFGPTSRFKDEIVHDELPELLRDKASEVRVQLAWEWDAEG